MGIATKRLKWQSNGKIVHSNRVSILIFLPNSAEVGDGRGRDFIFTLLFQRKFSRFSNGCDSFQQHHFLVIPFYSIFLSQQLKLLIFFSNHLLPTSILQRLFPFSPQICLNVRKCNVPPV